MDVYFGVKDDTELLNELVGKISNFDDHLEASGTLQELRDSYDTFYGESQVKKAGSEGQLHKIRINHYSSLIRNLISLVTNSRPAWQPVSANTDAESQAQALLASGLLDFYIKENHLDRVFKNACQASVFLKEAWVSATWDFSKGEIIHPGDSTSGVLPQHEGDISYKTYLLNDVIRDIYNSSSQQSEWLIVRDYVNKYELASRFPEYSDKILASKEENQFRYRINNKGDNTYSFKNSSENILIPVYTFYHKSCSLLPSGRQVYFIKDQILTDGMLAYPKIPLIKISAEEKFESCFSHSPFLDILPIQKSIDMLGSTILSNNAAFGVQHLFVKKGASLEYQSLSEGLSLIEGTEKPEPLNLTATSPETFKFLEVLIQQSQLLSGINDAVRGQSDAGQSGAALALLSQQAIQYANGLQQSYIGLVEDLGTLTIQILQRYADTKRVATLVGKNSQHFLKEWDKSNLSSVSRITVETGNALSKTTAGKLQIADNLLQAGMISHPQQYISVLQTGNLQPMLESETSQLMRIRKENESLLDGTSVRAIITDDHSLDVKEHLSLLDNPTIRENEALTALVLNHIQEHINLAKNQDPILLQLLGRQPLMVPQPQQPNLTTGMFQVTDATNPVSQAAQKVNQPNFPVNPMTGNQFNPSEQ